MKMKAEYIKGRGKERERHLPKNVVKRVQSVLMCYSVEDGIVLGPAELS